MAAKPIENQALALVRTMEPLIQVALLNPQLGIRHTDVAEYTHCYVNRSWANKLKELITSGWIVIRVLNESYAEGLELKVYLAKMNPV